MYTQFASGTLIVLGVLIAVLGLFAAGSPVLMAMGLVSVLAGGLLGLAEVRRAG